MNIFWVTFTLLSDATFGRGDGIAGLIDREVEHDRLGLPFLRGRTLKGMLCEEMDNLLYLLRRQNDDQLPSRWQRARDALFGTPAGYYESAGILHFGRASLPDEVRQQVAAGQVPPSAVLDGLTALRRQTANDLTGVPVRGSLRTMRVILRDTPFAARLEARRSLHADELALLAASVLAWQRAGTGRNRGRGRLQADLHDRSGKSILYDSYQTFVREALP